MNVPDMKLPFLEAVRSTLLQHVSTTEPQEEALPKCYGQVVAEDVRSDVSLPRCAEAFPDGYALCAADIVAASRNSPVTLRIVDTVRAGQVPKRVLKRGEAVRVMTGAIVPDGADCVVRFEDTDEPADKNGPNRDEPTEVRIFVSAPPASGIFAPGSSVKKGAVLVPAGTVIGPGQVSALTSIGTDRVRVYRRPVVAIIASGDELSSKRGALPPGRIHNSNSPALAELVRRLGCIPKVLGIARDRRASLERKLASALSADAILTSGGVSKGDFDLVRLMLGELGEVVLHRLPMGPGGSFAFGTLRRGTDGGSSSIPVFALAGPPAGCLVNFETLVRPALRKMLGHTQLRHPEVEAEAVDAVTNRKPVNFVRWTDLSLTPSGFRVRFDADLGQGFLMSMGRANSLTILPGGAEIRPGDKVRVMPLDWAQ